MAVVKTSMVYGNQKDIGIYALASVCNQLAAAGCDDYTLQAQIFVPPYSHKSRINTMKKHLKQAVAGTSGMELEINGAHSLAAALPFVVVSGAGEACSTSSVCAGQEIVLTKWIGLDGTLRIVDEKEKELLERFTPAFLRQIKEYEPEIWALKEANIAQSMGVSYMSQVSDGGILAALWNLALETECGLSVDMKKLSVKQETVEVCEHFRLNPYQLSSIGSMLMVTDNGQELVDKLGGEGIEASLIGYLTDNNDKVIHNGEEMRYIDRPTPDEISKIFAK